MVVSIITTTVLLVVPVVRNAVGAFRRDHRR
jgi:hypothetical protein